MQRYRGQQYSHLYYFRLHKFREILNPLIKKQWPNLPLCTILGLEDGKECIIVGTVYKQMQLRPSILDEYSKERTVTPHLHQCLNFVQNIGLHCKDCARLLRNLFRRSIRLG